MNILSKRMIFTMATLMGVLGLTFASSAPANGNPPPTTTVVSSSVTPVIYGAKASASDVATGRVTILQDMRVKASVKTSSPKCKWSKGGFWNSGNGTNGARSFWDPVPGKLCPSKASKTGWVKVAGGTSGRNCGNVASFGKPAYPVVKGKVLMVQSLASIRIQLKAQAEVKVTAVCGYAFGKASSSVFVTYKAYVRSRGPVSTRIYNEVLAKATAQASAKIECISTPPVPAPVCPPGMTGTPPNCVSPPPPTPSTAPVYLVKETFVDGNKTTPQTGAFTFQVNGGSTFTNSAGTTHVGNFNVGTSVTICEINTGGYTPDSTCLSATLQSNGLTFVFRNRKTTPPPAAQPPMLSNPTNPEEIYANGETYPNVCITVSGKNGNSLTVSFGSRYGSWQGGTTTTFTSQGVDRICKTYVAPRDTSVVGKYEQFTFNVHDNTTGLNGQEVKGLEFPIKAPPARP